MQRVGDTLSHSSDESGHHGEFSASFCLVLLVGFQPWHHLRIVSDSPRGTRRDQGIPVPRILPKR